MRASIAHRWTQQCDGLWIVTTIGRANADVRLGLTLATHAERFGNNCAVIATGSDVGVNDALAQSMENEKRRSVGDYWNLDSRRRQLREDIDSIENRLPGRRKKRARTLNTQQENELRVRKEKLEDDLSEVQNEQFEELVGVRSAYIKHTIQCDKQCHMAPDATLSVFCISNTHYAAHKGVIFFEDSRRMSVRATAIPDLRHHAYLMAAPSRLRETKAYIHKVVILCRGVDMWATATPQKRHEALMHIVKEPAGLLRCSAIGGSSTAMPMAQLIQSLDTNRQQFIDAALTFKQELDDPGKWNASTTRAFFAKNGKHRTSRKDDIWNERFTKYQTDFAIDPVWTKMVDEQKTSLAALISKIVAQLQDLPDALASKSESAPVPVERIEAMITGYTARIEIAHDARVEEMSKTFA